MDDSNMGAFFLSDDLSANLKCKFDRWKDNNKQQFFDEVEKRAGF
jgi:hypothetical protein